MKKIAGKKKVTPNESYVAEEYVSYGTRVEVSDERRTYLLDEIKKVRSGEVVPEHSTAEETIKFLEKQLYPASELQLSQEYREYMIKGIKEARKSLEKNGGLSHEEVFGKLRAILEKKKNEG